MRLPAASVCYAGAFPLWLAPVQVRFLMVTDTALPYVESLAKQFRAAGVRVEINTGEPYSSNCGGLCIAREARCVVQYT